jgi:beta-fructofuranosidase
MPDHPYDNPTDALGWENALTVPRELTWEDGCVRQKPVSELAQLRGSALEMDEEGAVCFADGAGDVEADLTGVQGGWSIQIGEGVTLRYEGGVISLQMSWRAGRGRTCRRIRIGQVTDMRMLIDTSVLEIYFNGGQYVMTSRFYPDYESPARRRLTVRFHCPGAKVCSWQMNTMQTNIDLQ